MTEIEKQLRAAAAGTTDRRLRGLLESAADEIMRLGMELEAVADNIATERPGRRARRY
jgi:hypothetical protein